MKKKYSGFLKEKSFSAANDIVLSLDESDKSAESIRNRDKIGRIVLTVFTYLFIIALALVVIFPFYWMIITSLKQNEEIQATTQTFFPNIVMWSNYVHVLQVFKFGIYMRNTIVVALISTAGTLITTILAGFAFGKMRFKGKEVVFIIFLMTMMIPGEMMVITNYITVASFGWIGSGQTLFDAYAAMIVPFWTSVFYIYLLRQNIMQIPNELYLAAKVDGKSDWSYLWKVIVPLVSPTLISIVILKFMGTWNSYVWPQLVTAGSSSEYQLISNGLRGSGFVDPDTGNVEYGYQMAATVLVTVPLFLLFIFFRKYIMKGVGRAGIKG